MIIVAIIFEIKNVPGCYMNVMSCMFVCVHIQTDMHMKVHDELVAVVRINYLDQG